MRRPILGNGFPKVIPLLSASPDGLAVLNLQTLPAEAQDRVHLLTLFATPFTFPIATTLSVLQQNAPLDPQQEIGSWSMTGLDGGVPFTLLNRFPVRGTQRIAVGLSVAPVAPVDVRVFGYFELEADSIPDVQGVRPLNNVLVPVKPFLAGARAYTPGNSHTLHVLTNDYIDQITLDVALPSDTIGDITMQGETDYRLQHPSLVTAQLSRVFDGIPMRSQYPLKLNLSAAAGLSYAVGTFKRD
jgi:hypothetical protein